MKKIVILFLLSISLFGCGTSLIKHFVETPQIKGIELKSFSAKNKQALFEVALHNPNSFSLPISGLNGDIVLNQLTIGSIDAETDKSIAAHTTQIVSLPISLDADTLIKAAKSVLSKRQAQYTFNGDILTSVGQIPFSKKGDLSMKDLIAMLLR
jgi:LEA14-like dessication related protein